MIKKAYVLIGLLCASVALPSCYCWQPAHVTEPKCVLAHQAVDCTKEAVFTIAPAIGALVLNLIEGMNPGQINWTPIEEQSKAAGFKNVGCFLAALENDFVQKAIESPGASFAVAQEKAHKVHTVIDLYRQQHGLVGVAFKVKMADGRIVTR